MNKPPLALLMYSPIAMLPAVAGPAIFFAVVIAGEVLLLRLLLLQLGFDELACLGGTIFLLIATLFKYQLDYVSLSHLTNLLVLAASIAAVKGSTRGVIISGLLIAASFYIRQNNVILALYPVILGRYTDVRTLAGYAAAMFVGFLGFLALFCMISDVNIFLYTTFVHPFKYADAPLGDAPSNLDKTISAFALGILPTAGLILFGALWSLAAVMRIRPLVDGIRMLLLLAVAFITVVAPNKTFYHYQGYLLIWIGLLGASAAYILVSVFFRQRERGLVFLAAGGAIVLLAAAGFKQAAVSHELTPPKNRLDQVLPKIREALASRPGHPTLQILDPVYTDHESYDGLILMLTGTRPATPLIFTPFFAPWWAATLPSALRHPWALLAQSPPDFVVLKGVDAEHDLSQVGRSFAPDVYQFLTTHGYCLRKLGDALIIAERPW